MPFYKKVQLKVIHDSKYGVDEKGVFAVEKISKGEELIYEYDPLVEEWPFYLDNDKRGKYTKAELFKLIENNPQLSKLITHYAYMVDDDLFNVPLKDVIMDSENVEDCEKRFPHTIFINHCCDPNIGFIEVTTCHALRDIDIGEEITFDYNCIDTENSLRAGTKCQCGLKEKCRQVLRMDLYKDPAWRQKNEQYCFPYVKKKIQELLHNNETIAKTAIIEQQMSMPDASMFWLDVLHGYQLDRSLSLPFDRYRLVGEDRTGRGISVSVDFGEDLLHHLLHYASSMNIKLEHLVFAVYYVFMFKLTNGETDLCVAVKTDSRHRDEFKIMIDLFENIVPLRCQLDPHWSFRRLIEHICEIITGTMKYSYFPLKRILAQYSNASKPAFLDILFEFLSMTSIRSNDEEIMSNFDFSLTMQHNPETNQLSCTIDASLDLFNRNTIEKIGQRFHSICKQLFASTHDQTNQSIYELSLVMPDERLLMQSMNNTQVSFPSSTCIHQVFVCQVMKHPQKLAVELDEQSLTYCELLYYVKVLSFHLLMRHLVVPGEIICQCVERSLSMVIGIMAIEMAGGVYCPLSPRDPQHRLHALIQQTQSRLVLVHHLTKTKLSNNFMLFDISLVLSSSNTVRENDISGLGNISITPDHISYIIFTSGSTGVPKAIQIRHRNISQDIDSMAFVDAVNSNDIVAQTVRCSFDVHVVEIIGTLILGGTLIMLRPGGILDLKYFSEAFTPDLSKVLTSNTAEKCHIWNMYGPGETIYSTFQHIDPAAKISKIPIGLLMPNYLCHILNADMQGIILDGEGELYLGGVGVCAGYLQRDDLTAKALVEINGDVFYRTGDVVRMDCNGLLHYMGRKDFQVKLRGQRIELGEIEGCLLNITSISVCIVMKWNDDHLVAYVQSSSSHLNEEQLRQHCESYLPSHMIPSFFVILDKLPLNANGKVDRKQLPPPHFSSIHRTNSIELLQPTNDIELSIHHIWCDIFKLNQISTDANIFTIGGHSLLMIELFHRYKIEFYLEQKQSGFSISNLFQHPTIIHHAQLIQQSINIIHTLNDYPWSSLHLSQGKQSYLKQIESSTIYMYSFFFLIPARASFAQERIYLDEQIRFSSEIAMNNMYAIPFLYRISSINDYISITRLYHAFQSVITKHSSLRTALFVNTSGHIIQYCLDTNIIFNDDTMKSHGLTIINIHNDDHRHMNEIISEILNQADLFDLSKGHVVNCHILRHQQSNLSFTQNRDLLTKDDLILFTIHHAYFDGASTPIFLRDLSLAYQSNDMFSIDDNSLQYIDYSTHEHIMDMTLSQEFWQLELKGCNLTHQLPLPVDRQRSSTNQQRSGVASIAEIIFDNELCTSFLNYASSHHLTLFQLGLSIFYVFLFKLTHGETDLCISSINANRYRNELQNLIGMFVSTLPYRVETDSHWSFDEVVKHVREKCLSILEYSHYPLQHILVDNRLNQSSVSFLEIMFAFISVSRDVEHVCLNDVNLEGVPLETSYEEAKFDFSLTFVYNPLLDNKILSYHFVCAHDLYEKSTISTIAQRFRYMFEQLFQTQSSNIPIINVSSSIKKLSLTLPEEGEEMELVVFHRLENIVNEAPASFAQARIWLDEKIRFEPNKPQIATYNMPFVYRLQLDRTLSVKELRHAIHLTVNKHPSLHTSLYFDIEKNLLMQRAIAHEDKNNHDMFSIIESTYETDEQLNEILHDEKRNPHLFDLAQGLVFRCHIIYYKQISSNHHLSLKDLLILNFHHALFDFQSMTIFLHDLNRAYTTRQIIYDDNSNLRYLDYALIEQEMSMTGASMFWLDALHNCKFEQPLSLPYDRYRLSNEHPTGHTTSISFDFGQDLLHAFLTQASSNIISFEHLTFAICFIFLFKLTSGQTDLSSYNHQSGEGWNFSATPSMLLECFPNLDSDLLAICKHCEDIKLWKLFIHEPYPYWVKGCVALLGDAAHPMLPDQSQGACMAIEDAAALGIIFSPKYWGNKIFTVEHGLKIYELLRKTRATRVQEASSRVPENFNERIDWNSQRNHDNQQSATTILTIDEINAYDMEKHLDDLLN
ncbi:unnamed protein product [Adineta steineri]|uniref:Uncharacterized protein n=2 Tax=Adineta steineri TaxID=433720 RepID=A0A813WE90_9BILA|nr:unnamed protein product [Adineta steineri]